MKPTPRLRRSRVPGAVALGVLLAGIAVARVDGLRWRAQVVGLMALGRIPDIGWRELLPMLRPRSPFYLGRLGSVRNPYHVIVAPDTSAAALDAGAILYRSRCAVCHGVDGAGDKGPSLVGTGLAHGGSDWAIYRAIAHGYGTGMPPAEDLTGPDRWRIVAYVRSLGARARRAGDSASGSAGGLERLRAITPGDLAAARSDPADWLTYSGAYDSWRYSALARINRGNVRRMRLLWIHQIPGGERQRFETTPLVVDGTMFFTTPTGGVRALDAATGSLLWSFERALPGEGFLLCCGVMNRGLAILGTTLFLATLDAHLIALDARTGAVRWDIVAADYREGYSFTSAPLVVKDLVVIGSAGGEYATRGFIDAYEAGTGRRRWRFHTTPDAGAPGSETWSGDSWKTGGAPPWLTGSWDPVLDLIYWGVGNPNPDYNGDDRRGDNLFSNSVVALEAASGKLRWHFQFTPHDEHDWDAAQIPVLVDRPGAGSGRLLLWGNRNAFYYVLDRVTGRFLRAREFAYQNWAEGIDSAGRPIVRAASAPSREGTRTSPPANGATNWWSPTYSPRSGLFYLQTFEHEDLYFKDNAPGEESGRLGGGRRRARREVGRQAIRALDPLTGERRWEAEVFSAAGEYLPSVGGLLSTAGDLVFGAGGDLVLVLDALSGERLWSFRAGAGVHAAPVTYLTGGKQRVTVAAGNALLTFGIE